MPIDFEQEFGVNAGYVELLYEYLADRESGRSVDESWRDALRAPGSGSRRRSSSGCTRAPLPAERIAEAACRSRPWRTARRRIPRTTVARAPDCGRGVAHRHQNMTASLELPTATSVRTLPMPRSWTENRRVLNEHMLAARARQGVVHAPDRLRAGRSALGEMPRMIVQPSAEKRDGRMPPADTAEARQPRARDRRSRLRTW